MPSRPRIMPPVGKSGPGISVISSPSSTSGSSSTAQQTSMASPRLCGGMFVAIPTAMPVLPLTRRLGMRDGRTSGSWSDSSKFGPQSIVSSLMSASISSPSAWSLASV